MGKYYIYAGRLYSEDELRHHGILGMKWGVRRFQNKDGSLTEEGKKRLSKQEDAKSAAEYYKRKRTETDALYVQEAEKQGILGEQKWKVAVAKGYKGSLEDWFETEMWKDLDMVDQQTLMDSLLYKYHNLDRKSEASLAYAEALIFENSDRKVDKITSDGIWKEGKEAVNKYLNERKHNPPTFKRDPSVVDNARPYREAALIMRNALNSKIPYHVMSEQERSSIDNSYRYRREALLNEYRKAETDSERKRLMEEADNLELDYLEIVERD